MRPEEKDLEKIIEYCERIEEYIQIYGDDEEDFLNNKVFQEGSAFCLIQIGEAVARLPENVKALDKDTEWSDIKEFRNILVHRYGTVWMGDFWHTLIEDVPILRKTCEDVLRILKKCPDDF